MRWRFPDIDDPLTARERSAILDCIDRWWGTFTRHADELDAHFSRREPCDVSAVMEALAVVDPELGWEFGPAVGKAGHRLCLSVEGKCWRRPLVAAMLDRSPSLPRWEFYPDRLAEPPGEVRTTVDSRFATGGNGVVVTLTAIDNHRFDLRFHFPPAAWPTDPKEAQRFAFYTALRLLSEEKLDRWIGGVEATRDPPAEPVLIERLPTELAKVTTRILADLPITPRFRHVYPPDAEGGVFRRQCPSDRADYPAWSDLAFASTPEPALWRATHAKRFDSARFSRCGETFCYLKLAGLGGLKGKVADRGTIADALSAALVDAKLGIAIGGGTGHVYSYIDLALTDVPSALPLIRDVLRHHRAHQRSWLLFYDESLFDEWLGIWPDTPAPPRT